MLIKIRIMKKIIPVVPHEAVPEVSKGKLHINQKKYVPIEIVCDMFEHFAFRATLFLNTATEEQCKQHELRLQ